MQPIGKLIRTQINSLLRSKSFFGKEKLFEKKKMFQTKPNDEGGVEGGGGTLGASLVITSTSCSGKYLRFWRLSFFIGILISRKKTTAPNDDGVASPSPPPPPATSGSKKEEEEEEHEGDEEHGLLRNIHLDSAQESYRAQRSLSCSVLSFHLETGVNGSHGQEASEANGFLVSKARNSITRSFSDKGQSYVTLPPPPPTTSGSKEEEEEEEEEHGDEHEGDEEHGLLCNIHLDSAQESYRAQRSLSCSVLSFHLETGVNGSHGREASEANGFLNILSKARNRITRSFSDHGQSYVALPPPPAEEKVRFQCAINIPSVVEEEEEENDGDHAEEEQEQEQEQEQQLLRKSVARIVKERDLPSLKKLGGVERAASILGSNLETGISEIEDPRALILTNPVHDKGFLNFFLDSCNRYHIFILAILAGLSFPINIMQEGLKCGWYEGAAILVVVFLLVTFPSVANFRSSRKLQKQLRDKGNKLEVTVVRDGKLRLVAVSGIVVGDIVCLKKDGLVPADGLFVHGENLVLDEVYSSKIDRDQNPFLFSGSKVKKGRGRMLVTSVGRNTKLGKVLSLSTRDANDKKVFEARIDKPTICIDILALCVSVLIALVVLIRLLCKKNAEDTEFPESKGNVTVEWLMNIFVKIFLKPHGRISILTNCLAVLVIMFQHGMPFVITLSLSYWNDMVKLNQAAEPQNLSACGTMGLVTVICIDVTGEIMCKKMEVEKFWIGQKDMNNDVESVIDPIVLEALQRGIGVLVPEISVSPTNDWLISWAKSRLGMNMEFLDQSLAILDCGKLSCSKKGSGILMKKNGDNEKIFHLHWKGPASIILDMCSHYYDSGGIRNVMEDQKEKFEQVIKDMEDSGLRPIAFAYRQTEEQQLKEDGLNLLAVVGVKYVCQEETKSAVEALRNGGVNIKLVSEDEPSAVRAIAYELGFFRPNSNDVAVDGEEILELTAMMEKVDQMTVIGSILPEGKLLLVQSLQQKGQVVAFFGGSTTMDTPALQEADVGITERTRSTDMAGESSDIVISDDGFSSLFSILKSGRCVYHNIQKFTQLQLTACISGSLITIVTTIIVGESPITSIHLIWVNLIMCILGGVMMVMELPNQELISDEPDKRSQSLITKVMRRNIVTQVLYQAFVLLIFQFMGQGLPGMKKVQKVMISNSFTLCQVFNQFNAMHLVKKEVLVVVLYSYLFLLVLVEVMLVQFLLVEFAERLVDGARLNGVQWVFCILIAALSWGFGFAVKFTSDSYSNLSFRSTAAHSGFSISATRTTQLYVSCLGFPFNMFFFFCASYYVNTGIARTFR